MNRQIIRRVQCRNKVVNLAVGITGDFVNGVYAYSFFIKLLDGLDGKNLVSSPVIRNGLIKTDVADIFVG